MFNRVKTMKLISKYNEFEMKDELITQVINSSEVLRLACKDHTTYLKIRNSIDKSLDNYKEWIKTKMFKGFIEKMFGMKLNSERLF